MADKETTLVQKLCEIQGALNAPKGQRNEFGKYRYRSCEDILEAVKPLLTARGCVLTLTDSIELIGDRYYVKSIARLTDGNGSIDSQSFAREPSQKKGMDEAQISGAVSSYARKYSLNALFCIDDCKDSDTMDNREAGGIPKPDVSEVIREVDERIQPEQQYDDGQYEPLAVYESVKNALGGFCKKTGYKKTDVNNFIKERFDGKTIAQMKNDDGLLVRVLKAVENDYTPSIGDSVEGAIPGKVINFE